MRFIRLYDHFKAYFYFYFLINIYLSININKEIQFLQCNYHHTTINKGKVIYNNQGILKEIKLSTLKSRVDNQTASAIQKDHQAHIHLKSNLNFSIKNLLLSQNFKMKFNLLKKNSEIINKFL